MQFRDSSRDTSSEVLCFQPFVIQNWWQSMSGAFWSRWCHYVAQFTRSIQFYQVSENMTCIPDTERFSITQEWKGILRIGQRSLNPHSGTMPLSKIQQKCRPRPRIKPALPCNDAPVSIANRENDVNSPWQPIIKMWSHIHTRKRIKGQWRQQLTGSTQLPHSSDWHSREWYHQHTSISALLNLLCPDVCSFLDWAHT